MKNFQYILKLTPNKKDVIINTDVLVNGYENVEYPIPLKTTSQLGYVLDPSTFKFEDSDNIQHLLYPYPVKLEITPFFNIIPFYGVNNEFNDDKIIILYPKWVNDDNTVNKFIEDGDHDTAVFIPNSDETGYIIKDNEQYYVVDYKIIVKVYWSDNKPNSSIINNWLNQNSVIGTYPFVLNFNYNILAEDSFGETSSFNIPEIFNNLGDNLTDNIFLSIKDSEKEYIQDLIEFTFTGTFTDPRTMVSVSSTSSIIVQQEAYPGKRLGYVTVKFLDSKPLDIWSPTIQYTYKNSENNEANPFLDKKSLTEFLTFCIDSSYSNTSSNFSYYNLYEPNFLPYYYTEDKTLNTLTAEERQEELRKLMNSSLNGKLTLYDISINNYYTDSMILNNLLYPDSSDVILNIDEENFKNRFNICSSNNLFSDKNNDDVYIIPEDEYDTSDNIAYNKIIKKYNITVSGKYIARYATYVIIDTEYHQILKKYEVKDEENDTSILYYDIAPDTQDHDIYEIENYYNYLNKINNDEDKKASLNNAVFQNSDIIKKTVEDVSNNYNKTNYKIIYNDGKTIQYKYCVNNIFNEFKFITLSEDNIINIDSSVVQMPRFGVYPIMAGQIPLFFSVYDYTTDDIPYKDLTKYNNKFVYRENGKLIKNTEEITKILKVKVKNIVDNNIKDFIENADVQQVIKKADITADIANSINNNVNTQNNIINNSGIMYGATSDECYLLSITDPIIPDILKDNIRINGIKYKDLTNNTLISYVKPYIFTISLDQYPIDLSTCLNITITDDITGNGENTINCTLILTNDENEKHLKHYDNKGNDINNNHSSFMLLRANPKLSGNVKFVIDSSYNLYLDTFKASPKLNDYRFRKYPISADGNYPRDIKTVFKNLPVNELYKIPENSFKVHKVYTDFNNQYETMYEYGAETNTDNLYNENMKILAPLYIGDNIPTFFTIFRYDDIFNEETYNGLKINDINKFESLIKKSKVVTTFDLRTYTSIGQYLNNYKEMLSNYGQCYLQFIEQDNDKVSQSYRQGNNIWKGISVLRGILTNQSETSYFAAKLLNDENITNKQELFNNFIMKGFERHHLLYPNILNLEFMFNDNSQDEYSMHRYFGLYLTENDFIKYGYIISNNMMSNNVFKKYDINGNLFTGDLNIFKTIFTEKYNNRIFYAITNDNSNRVQSEIDVNNFLNQYVKNLPEKNLTNIKSERIIFNNEDKSFITLHFSEPIKYGEHFKFIALNRQLDNKTYTNSVNTNNSTNRLNNLPYEHIVYEIIASNDERLRYTDYNISPYVNTQKCEYSENTYFIRISFYTQDVNYPEISATLSDQIKRIVNCIKKFDTFIKVSSYNNMSIAVISEHNDMYFQHIDAVDLIAFKYDYVNWMNITEKLITTNRNYLNSIQFLPHQDIEYVDIYDQTTDNEHEWLKNLSTDADNEYWRHYVEVEDPENIKLDTISYFNKDTKYNMYALTNQSDYFDTYYVAFCNYCFETLGWRYNNIVKFINIDSLNNSYNLIYKDIYEFVKDIKYLLVQNTAGNYETLNTFNIKYGYLRNNIYDPDLYEAYTTVQQFIFKQNTELNYITSPYNIDNIMICSTTDILLTNNFIRLYKPKSASIAIMGISNIKDIDVNLDLNLVNHQETNLTINVPASTTILVDESDYRIQHGVMYQMLEGKLYYNDEKYISNYDKFIIIKNKNIFKIYVSNTSEVYNCNSLYAKTDVIYKISDKQIYQDYNYDTSIPSNKTDNFYINPNNLQTSDLLYPIVPQVQCNWKSNGQYLDHNNILDVNNLNKNYEVKGHFIENIYTPSNYDINQYVTNKIDNLLFVNGKTMTYKECILNNSIQHPIKQLLIDNVNIDTASAYYNSNTQSLEFIFFGIKFNIKLNTKIVNTFIHLDDYTGFQVFIINDYDISKRNELYISYIEKFILIINHQFYIDYEHEAVSNIKNVNKDAFAEYVPYSAFKAPYSIDFRTTSIIDNNIVSHKKDNIILKSLAESIDQYNLWNSLFTQYDIPELNTDDNNPMFIQSYIEGINEYDGYLTMNSVKSDIGIISKLNENSTYNIITPDDTVDINVLYSYSYPYIITKADGNYNHTAYQLLQNINNKISLLIKNTIDEQINQKDDKIINDANIPDEQQTPIPNIYGASSILVPQKNNLLTSVKGVYKNTINTGNSNFIIHTSTINNLENISINEDIMKLRLLNDNKSVSINYLSDMLNTPVFRVLMNTDNLSAYKNILIPKTYLTKLQDFIKILVTKENTRDKQERYIRTFDNNIDIYIIPENTDVKYIKNTNNYNPLIFELSIPNMIKYNYGWFTPNMNNMMEFYINDELKDILNIELLQSNTLFKNIYQLQNYSGNKVFDDLKLQNVYKNYYLIENRSLLSSTWDNDYYRKYLTENNYEQIDGHLTGIDDKSFFGSRCMIIHNPYIQLDTWLFDTANDIYTTDMIDSKYNVQFSNTKNYHLIINLSSALYNHFINNKAFNENWNYFKQSQITGMKNYINNTISASYNMNSNLDITLYYIDTDENQVINIINKKPENLQNFKIYEGYSTQINLKNNIYTLRIVIPKTTGMNIYPVIKIYRK